MRSSTIAMGVLFAVSPAAAVVISQHSECILNTPEGVLQSFDNPCSLSYTIDGFTVNVQAGIGGVSRLGFDGGVEAAAYASGLSQLYLGLPTAERPDFIRVDGSIAHSSMAIETFATPGPMRPGMLLVRGVDLACSLDVDSVTLYYSVAGHTGGMTGGSCGGLGVFEESYPIQLGEPLEFLFSFGGRIISSANFVHSGQIEGFVLFNFLAVELDGTPVAFSPVPEPSGISLIGLALLALRAASRRRPRRRIRSRPSSPSEPASGCSVKRCGFMGR